MPDNTVFCDYIKGLWLDKEREPGTLESLSVLPDTAWAPVSALAAWIPANTHLNVIMLYDCSVTARTEQKKMVLSFQVFDF